MLTRPVIWQRKALFNFLFWVEKLEFDLSTYESKIKKISSRSKEEREADECLSSSQQETVINIYKFI